MTRLKSHLIESSAEVLEFGENGRRAKRPACLVLEEGVRDRVYETRNLLDAVVEEFSIVVNWYEALDVQIVHVKVGAALRDVVGDHLSNPASRADPVGTHGSGDEILPNLNIRH